MEGCSHIQNVVYEQRFANWLFVTKDRAHIGWGLHRVHGRCVLGKLHGFQKKFIKFPLFHGLFEVPFDSSSLVAEHWGSPRMQHHVYECDYIYLLSPGGAVQCFWFLCNSVSFSSNLPETHAGTSTQKALNDYHFSTVHFPSYPDLKKKNKNNFGNTFCLNKFLPLSIVLSSPTFYFCSLVPFLSFVSCQTQPGSPLCQALCSIQPWQLSHRARSSMLLAPHSPFPQAYGDSSRVRVWPSPTYVFLGRTAVTAG